MQIRNLQVFCDVVRRSSFSKAAADNSMTQSGASQAVQQLEEFLKVQLIDRSKRPLQLTAEGRVFHSGCLEIVKRFESLSEEVRAVNSEVRGKASVAAIYSVGLSYLPKLQKRFKVENPVADVRYQFGHPDEVYRLVEDGIVDFGLVSYPESSKAVKATLWREESMILAAAPTHPLAGKRDITTEDLSAEALVAFAPNLRIRHEIDRYLRQVGVTMPIAAEFDNIDSVKHGMALYQAVAFLPRPTVVEELQARQLVQLDCPWMQLSRPLGIIQCRSLTLSRTARGVMELFIADAQHAANISEAGQAHCAEPAMSTQTAGDMNADDISDINRNI
ncbi:MAG TPA: transcriptional regulator [Planctomycetaceae bacterium]|nr:transcriptional regulator [Planctomycetaceae bacterium]